MACLMIILKTHTLEWCNRRVFALLLEDLEIKSQSSLHLLSSMAGNPREQNGTSLSPLNQSNTNRSQGSVSSCMQKKTVFSPNCVQLPCYLAFKKILWPYIIQRKHILAFTLLCEKLAKLPYLGKRYQIPHSKFSMYRQQFQSIISMWQVNLQQLSLYCTVSLHTSLPFAQAAQPAIQLSFFFKTFKFVFQLNCVGCYIKLEVEKDLT